MTLSLLDKEISQRATKVDLCFQVDGPIGERPRIVKCDLAPVVDDFFGRLCRHRRQFLPGLRCYQALCQEIIEHEHETLRLVEFRPQPLSSFVRNKLISDVHPSVAGDDLVRQTGTIGESKCIDLMGLPTLISPPGYDKTTPVEYAAHYLGLIFIRINGLALGHEVCSLNPRQASDVTSRQGPKRFNLALEVGNNVVLYISDIQHTRPEFLQKFISPCDGTYRVGGIWEGWTKTYDIRRRKFYVVMVGSPYAESGEALHTPDMLANRADVCNLGDTLSGT